MHGFLKKYHLENLEDQTDILAKVLRNSKDNQISDCLFRKLDRADKLVWLCGLRVQLIRLCFFAPSHHLFKQIEASAAKLLSPASADESEFFAGTTHQQVLNRFASATQDRERFEGGLECVYDFNSDRFDVVLSSQVRACMDLLKFWKRNRAQDSDETIGESIGLQDLLKITFDRKKLRAFEQAFLDLTYFQIRYLKEFDSGSLSGILSDCLYPALHIIFQNRHPSSACDESMLDLEEFTDILWKGRFNFSMKRVKDMVLSFLVSIQLRIVTYGDPIFVFMMGKFVAILEEISCNDGYRPQFPSKHFLTPKLICKQLLRLQKIGRQIEAVCGKRRNESFEICLRPNLERNEVFNLMQSKKLDCLSLTDTDCCRENLFLYHCSRKILGIALVMVTYWNDLPHLKQIQLDELSALKITVVQKCYEYFSHLKSILFPSAMTADIDEEEKKIEEMMAERLLLLSVASGYDKKRVYCEFKDSEEKKRKEKANWNRASSLQPSSICDRFVEQKKRSRTRKCCYNAACDISQTYNPFAQCKETTILGVQFPIPPGIPASDQVRSERNQEISRADYNYMIGVATRMTQCMLYLLDRDFIQSGGPTNMETFRAVLRLFGYLQNRGETPIPDYEKIHKDSINWSAFKRMAKERQCKLEKVNSPEARYSGKHQKVINSDSFLKLNRDIFNTLRVLIKKFKPKKGINVQPREKIERMKMTELAAVRRRVQCLLELFAGGCSSNARSELLSLHFIICDIQKGHKANDKRISKKYKTELEKFSKISEQIC